MVMLRVLWRLVRHRWTRKILLWVAVRLLRLFGWRRALKLLFRGRGRWRLLAVGVWRVAVRLLRVGRSALTLSGWPRARRRPLLGHGKHSRHGATLGSTLRPRLTHDAKRSTLRPRLTHGAKRSTLGPRLARRRDELRRLALTALGIDPDWRPPSRRGIGTGTANGHEPHAVPRDRTLH
jgi:hypothetical protein